ncbi:hypothetical protein PG987_007208 [Apiospora arundinis]
MKDTVLEKAKSPLHVKWFAWDLERLEVKATISVHKGPHAASVAVLASVVVVEISRSVGGYSNSVTYSVGDWASSAISTTTRRTPLSKSTQGTSIVSQESSERSPNVRAAGATSSDVNHLATLMPPIEPMSSEEDLSNGSGAEKTIATNAVPGTNANGCYVCVVTVPHVRPLVGTNGEDRNVYSVPNNHRSYETVATGRGRQDGTCHSAQKLFG